MPAVAGIRLVAIVDVSFEFMVCLVAGDGFEPPTSGV
jgi:hypothetical protein